MARLHEVLEEASARKAHELVMESGQPVVVTTHQGPEALGEPLAEAELIDALTEVLDDEQQVELAVGNLIEFQIETSGGRWTLISEPAADGVLVRGLLHRPKAAARARGGALDLPPLDPFSPPTTGEPLDAPRAGADPERAKRPTVQEVTVDLDMPATSGTLHAGRGAFPPPGAAKASAAKSDVDASFEDLGFGAPISSPGGRSDATLFSPAGGPAPIPAMGPADPLDLSSAADIGFGEPEAAASELEADLVFGAPEPAPRSREQHGTLIMGSDAPRPDDGSLGIPEDDDDDDASFADLSVELEEEPPDFPPPSFEPPASPATHSGHLGGHDAPPAAPAATGAAGERLADLAISIEPGTLCFVHGEGAAEALAGYIGVPVGVIEDGSEGTRAVESLLADGAEPGTVVVRMEDPSVHLGFLLRRLEEGWRVLVETRARTAEGARRILLGVKATAVAEAWLDAQVTSWAMLEEGHWKLL